MTVLFTWVSVDARTGAVLADLPDLDTTSSLNAILGQYQTATVTLPLPTAPDGWRRATLPGAACVVLLAQKVDSSGNPTGNPIPLWGALILQRKRGVGDTVELSVSTLEVYFDRRYVGDITFTSTDQNVVVQTLINDFVLDGASGKPGIPIRVQITGTGPVMTISYADASDKTVYSALTELMGRNGGPEWTVGWEHQSNPERYTPVLYVSTRVGNAAQTGLSPAAVFEVPGPLATADLTEDFSSSSGATDVMAVSTASGNVRPQSAHHTSADTTRPTFEYRYTPSTSIVDTGTLDSHAAAALAIMLNGSTALAITADGESSPILGLDWGIGDDVGFVLGGLDDNGDDTVPGFPGGLQGTGRAIGWQITPSNTWTIAPIVSGVQIGA